MQQAARASDFIAFTLSDAERTGQLIEFRPTADIFTRPQDRRTRTTSPAGSANHGEQEAMRRAFDEDLQELQNQMLELGSMVSEALVRSVDALKRQDMEASRAVIRDDAKINEKRFAIETDCLRLIATQQPMARDLRSIAAVLEIITDLERCADYAAGIGKIALIIGKEPFIKPLIDIPRMLEKDLSMLDRAIKAFMDRDVEAARAIAAEDDDVDALYDQINNELIAFMLQDPRTVRQATRLLWVAHNLERFADRVTNICERVVFTVTGEMREMNIQEPEVEPQ